MLAWKFEIQKQHPKNSQKKSKKTHFDTDKDDPKVLVAARSDIGRHTGEEIKRAPDWHQQPQFYIVTRGATYYLFVHFLNLLSDL